MALISKCWSAPWHLRAKAGRTATPPSTHKKRHVARAIGFACLAGMHDGTKDAWQLQETHSWSALASAGRQRKRAQPNQHSRKCEGNQADHKEAHGGQEVAAQLRRTHLCCIHDRYGPGKVHAWKGGSWRSVSRLGRRRARSSGTYGKLESADSAQRQVCAPVGG